MTPEEERSRGQQAEILMRDPLLAEAFDAIERGYTEAWKRAKTPEDRERLHLAVTVAGKVRAHLQGVIGSGRLGDRQIKELEGRKPLLRRII